MNPWVIDDRLTIVVPTIPARSRFKDRTLNWYDRMGSKLLIGSDESITAFECIRRLLDKVQTPYAVVSADDDLLFSRGVNAAVALLESSLRHTLAHGPSLQFAIKENALYGPVEWIAPWRQIAQEVPLTVRHHIGPWMLTRQWPDVTPGSNEAGFKRAWTTMFTYRPMSYSVMRIDAMVQAYEFIHHNQDLFARMGFGTGKVNREEWSEFFQTLIPCFLGKAGMVNELYLMRQMHPGQVSKQGVDKVPHHPYVRNLIRQRWPKRFRQMQFICRSWPYGREFQEAIRFIEGQS